MKRIDKEKLLNTLNKLKDCILIVEGLKDEKALKTLGLKDIVRISGKSLIKVIENVKEIKETKRTKGIDDVIILTDFDSKGRKLAARLTRLLQSYRIHPNQRLRSEVMKLGWNKIEDMNGLRFDNPEESGFHIGGDDHVKVSTNINKVHDKSAYKSERRSRKTRYNRSSLRSD